MSTKKHTKTALVDVGGGLRDVYGCGILDYCMDHDIEFDHCIGVSAGCANIGAFLARQPRRDMIFYLDYAFRNEYMSFQNFVKSGNYVNLDYVYGTLTNEDGEYPLDYDAMMENPSRFTIVCANAKTGKVRYFEKEEIPRNHYDILKATACLPVVNHPQPVGHELYFDGGLADPIPIKFAFDEGCDKAIVILTKPRDDYRVPKADVSCARLLYPHYPVAAKNLLMRADRYNLGLDYAKVKEKQGEALILAPESLDGMKTLKKDKAAMMKLYLEGYRDGRRIAEFLGYDLEEEAS